MNFIRWLIGSLTGLLIGAGVIGTSLLMLVLGPFLAIGLGGLLVAFLVALAIKEVLDENAAKKKRKDIES